MRTFALIACDHGFGHVRRCLLIAKGLADRGMAVTLFAPRAAAARFPGATGVTIVDFETRTTISSLRSFDATEPCWTERLPSLETFDVVVCDNLPEILTVRPDAVLSGSFLWHLVVEGVSPHIRGVAELLLSQRRPRMIASEVFGMPDLAERTELIRVGLCVSGVPPADGGEDILIACGGTTAMEKPFRDLVEQLMEANAPGPRVLVEPRLLPTVHPTWMAPATFDEGMYRGLAAAVCRPGVGTMTDCAWAQARVFSAWETGNHELSFNAARFATLGIGESAPNPREAFSLAHEFVANPARRGAHAHAARSINLSGVRETCDALILLRS